MGRAARAAGESRCPPAHETGYPLKDADLEWRVWIEKWFRHVADLPFAARHVRFWEWIEALTPGVKPRPAIFIWPRGGGKSTSVELGAAFMCGRLSRRYLLYVSGTQEQAEKHVQAVASLLETRGVGRSLNVYGTSKGWRRQEIRTENGFNVSAYGLDTAARGVKLDQFRPDVICLDDVDTQDDSPKTVQKKIEAITTAILPAGSADCAVLFVQNKVHEDSIATMLCDGRADFLHDREQPFVEPAVKDLHYERVDRGDGHKVYRITGGEPTWEGQDLLTCQAQINEWGLRAFLQEAQHEVEGGAGYVFDVNALQVCRCADVPALVRLCRAWDLAATEGGGDWTVGVLMGLAANDTVYVLDMARGQWGSHNVRIQIGQACLRDRARWGNRVRLHLPQDPGQAGKDQAEQLRRAFAAYRPVIEVVSGDKVTRAAGLADALNSGNVTLVEGDWNQAFREELKKFRADVADQRDDIVDAASDAYNEIAPDREIKVIRF
ncbi:MAG TPA: phage terminase large subunit [Chthonomonadaceae bacterium]|nr:phage terminase large subunit [Chthonomonadaceae bacterium]